MFVSRFPFTAKFPQSISFSADDHFLGLRKENDHWLYVFHEDGRLGAVPINYVEESSSKSPEDVCKIIDSAIAEMVSRDIYEKETILSYLKELKDDLLSNCSKANLPNSRSNATAKKTSRGNGETKNLTAQVPGISFLMVDKLRNATLASFGRCTNGLVKVLKVLSDADPQLTTLSNELILELLDPNPTVRRSIYVRTEDWKGLQEHIAHLEQRAKNQQEGSWSLIDDDAMVISDLDKFVELLCNADPDMVCTCLSDDRLPLALSYLYQGEKNVLVRRFYLLVAMATCHIQPAVWPVYLDSGLPMEIIREIRSSDVGSLDFILDLRVLTVLLAKSNSLPVNLQNELNESFFDCVFGIVSRFVTGKMNPTIDKSPITGAMRRLCVSDTNSPQTQANDNAKTKSSILLLDTFIQFVCAANRHFCTSQSTPLTPITNTMLGNHAATRDLVERLLYIFNRDVDPLSLDGVLFVRRLRSALHEGFDTSSQLYSGFLLDEDPDDESGMGLFAKSRRISSTQSSAGENGAGAGEVSGSGEHVSSADESGVRVGGSGKSLHHRTGLTDATLQLAPDTPRNAARKLLADIFSNRDTANLIYHNDVNVVIDVIIRQICDLPANSPNLSEFLFCMDKVIRNTDCMSRSSGPYRLGDIIEALRGVEFSANTFSASNSRDFTISRSLRLTNDLLALLSAITSQCTA
ncbi:NCK-interacting protein with SH3 domain [Taenia solium]|eukprot:TsM_000863700 transcript=TsM_000863700 gene=TsM_000863700